MRYRLRTLMIVLALGPPMLALAWYIATAPQMESGFALMFTILGAIIFAIAYWPRIVGKGG